MSDARWGDPRECDARDPGDEWPRVYDPRDRHETRSADGLSTTSTWPAARSASWSRIVTMSTSWTARTAARLLPLGAFRVVPEHDLDIDHNTLEHLHDEGLVETVELDDDECGLRQRDRLREELTLA